MVKLREERLQGERERRLRYDRVDPQREGPPAELGDHEWLSIGQVAQRLGRTESAVRARAARGTIPHVRVEEGSRKRPTGPTCTETSSEHRPSFEPFGLVRLLAAPVVSID